MSASAAAEWSLSVALRSHGPRPPLAPAPADPADAASGGRGGTPPPSRGFNGVGVGVGGGVGDDGGGDLGAASAGAVAVAREGPRVKAAGDGIVGRGSAAAAFHAAFPGAGRSAGIAWAVAPP
ncbi:hypothetical protein CXG81DRAFT_27149 [Caulochytrium protostelioides]|uniref:Uncharacterized protein n=1 Tax=Caulochytrium protostelioides TaxID=1555241 RepID=A0A4P9X4X0_9FUNG|nr:hypothetical protein CXG81DRAFT_27149 [Caulochytrium protostelioides]|eukprot:RKP00115.1 hypothetical protein CXG81DRAFT_27149 [Caulochytrium protostelioides]